jgi:hypothetical protein
VLGYRRVKNARFLALWILPVVVGGCQSDSPGERNADSLAAIAASAAARAERGAQRCDAATVSLVVDSLGIGPVLRGTRIRELASRCPVADTAIALEGTPERAHVVTLRGHAVVVLSTGTPDTSIIRVVTMDPAFKTTGGVGVGSSVQALRLAHGRICAARGEGTFVVMAADLPGVSFAIDWSPAPSRDPSAADTPFPGGDPGTALDATRITRLWVHGVAGACRVSVG